MKTTAQSKPRFSIPVRPWESVRFSPPVLATPLQKVEFRLLEAHSTDMRDARVAVRFPPIQQSQTQALKLTNT